jgi:hypothetical protein
MLEGLGAEMEELRTMRQWEEPKADESQERKNDAESVEDAVEQKLALFSELLTQLTRKVEQLSLKDGGVDDNNGPRQVSEAGPSAKGRYSGFGRANDSTGSRDAVGWGGMRIGEATDCTRTTYWLSLYPKQATPILRLHVRVGTD